MADLITRRKDLPASIPVADTAPASAPVEVKDKPAAKETPLAPAEKSDKKAAVKISPAARTEVPHRAATLKAAGTAIRDIVRSHPADAAYVAKAFAKGDSKAIGQVVDMWRAEQRAIGAPGASLLTPVAVLCRMKGDARSMEDLPAKLAKPVLDAVEQLKKQKAPPELLAFVSKLASLMRSPPTRHPNEALERNLTLEDAKQSVLKLNLSDDESVGVSQLARSADLVLRLLDFSGPLNLDAVDDRLAIAGGACADVAAHLMPPLSEMSDERMELLLGSQAFRKMDAAALRAMKNGVLNAPAEGSLRRVVPAFVRDLEVLSAQLEPAALSALTDAFFACSAEVRGLAMRIVACPEFRACSEADQCAFLSAFKELPQLPASLDAFLPALIAQHCTRGMRSGETLRHRIRAFPLPFHVEIETGRSSAPVTIQRADKYETNYVYGSEWFDDIELRDLRGAAEFGTLTFADGSSTRIIAEPPPANAVRIEDVASALASVPLEIRRFVAYVNLSSHDVDNDGTLAWAQGSQITTFRRLVTSAETLRSVLIHEGGHVMATTAFGAKDDPRWERWHAAVAADGAVISEYARQSPHEDFAETLVMYEAVAGTKLEAPIRALFSQRFAIIDRFLGKHLP